MTNVSSEFKQALLDAVLEEYSYVSEESPLPKDLTEACQTVSLDRPRRGIGYFVRIAAIAAVFLAALAGTAMAIPAVRQQIIRFFTRNQGTHYAFSFESEQAVTAPKEIETVYQVTYLPDGFQLVSEVLSPAGVVYDWIDSTGEYMLSFEQYPTTGDLGGGPDAEDVASYVYMFDGNTVFCVETENYRLYHWTDDQYFYVLTCSKKISEGETRKIFQSITIKPTEKIP